MVDSLDQSLEKLAKSARVLSAKFGDGQPCQNRKRNRYIRIYLYPEEEQLLLDQCGGLPASVYCRQKLLGGSVPRPKRPIPEVNRQHLTQLLKLSNNLNQLSRAANKAIEVGFAPPLPKAYLLQLAELKELLQENVAHLKSLCDVDLDNAD